MFQQSLLPGRTIDVALTADGIVPASVELVPGDLARVLTSRARLARAHGVKESAQHPIWMNPLFVDDGSRAPNGSRARRQRDERFAGYSTARVRAVRDEARAMRGALCRAPACQRWQPPVGRSVGY